MSLEFADFAHFYADSGLTENQQREDFEAYACFMECLVRHFWGHDPIPNSLGIRFDNDTMALIEDVDSKPSLQAIFNDAAHEDAAGKTDS
ncbi:hypothetical protein CAP40_01475 [Sphingomonas sp. IBVSS2]|uniref:hypothetical protein n=1 Tax=Sphingomonas sp. IBVSS2 TaxID=1985172 RepID=UPI000A2DE729|nr:hypothetical protein [Sphingomonas sp. IBVSS2]OSZ69554.1 hypothetical protein CAP40_01475 [Sphingomonas sp. IBVSS2]